MVRCSPNARFRTLVTSGILVLTAALVWSAPVFSADNRAEAKAQVEFGIVVAQKGLWQEALYRFERAVAIDPGYAAGYNNLAVAFEQNGRLDEAREAYEKAIELDPRNTFVRQNYDLFLEVHARTMAANGR